MTSTRGGGGPGSPAAAAAPRGVLGQPGVLAEAEQLGDPLGDQVALVDIGEQLGQPAPGLRGGVVGAIPAAWRTTSTIGHMVTLSPNAGSGPEDLGLVAEAADELVDQARLADPGRAEHADQVAGPLGGRPLEQPPQQLLLAAPPDHGRDRPPGSARAVGQDLEQPPDVLRLGGP